jgi:hypothetical protein
MFRPMDSKERSLGSGLKDDKRVIGSVGFQSRQRPINLPHIFEFASKLAEKKERNYVKFRRGPLLHT